MKPKQILVLLSILAILVVLIVWPMYKSSRLTSTTLNLKLDDFGEIVISNTSKEIILKKSESGAWQVDGQPMDTEKLNSLSQSLTSLELLRIVSQNPANHSQYLVGDSPAYKLTFRSNEAQKVITIGKAGPDMETTYLRQDDGAEVWLAKTNLPTHISTDSTYWLPPKN